MKAEHCADAVSQLDSIAALLAENEGLAKAHTAAFFSDRLHASVAPDWLPALADAPLEQLHRVPSGASLPGWPPALRAFLERSADLSLPRLAPSPEATRLCRCCRGLESALDLGTPAKKRHEVAALAQLVAAEARAAGVDTVVDVGGGQGHLAAALAHRHGLRVLLLDACAPLAAAAAERASKLAALRRSCAACAHLVVGSMAAVACRLDWGGEGASPLAALLREHLGTAHVLLVGLHACGDLTPGLLRAFLACEAVVAVVAVGCCYNLLTDGREDGEGGAERSAADSVLEATAAAVAQRRGTATAAAAVLLPASAPGHGFPLSAHVQNMVPPLRLGRRGRSLACQSAARWACGGGAPKPPVLRHMLVRAALEAFRARLLPRLPAEALRRVTVAGCEDEAGWAAHARAALLEAGLPAEELPTPAALDGFWLEHVKPYARLLLPFLALRSSLAGPLEAAIVLDRLLLLREAGTEARILPIFDAEQSPRNLALISHKRRDVAVCNAY